MDQELRFKSHTNYALQKGSKLMDQYRQLVKTAKGISAKHMRQFYIAVALPKILYAADIFLIPESKHNKGTKGFITKLA